MGRRTKARECAFQMLYQWQITGEPMERVIESFWKLRSGTESARAMAERLARGAQAEVATLDHSIDVAATHWRLERIALVERTILRLGAYELLRATAPVPVVIDEAVELAKRFGEAESAAFVNGVLDAIHRAQPGDPAGASTRAQRA